MHEVQNNRQQGFLLFAVLILLAGYVLRQTGLLNFPLFYDEAFHIVNAQRVVQGEIFAGFDESSWFYSIAAGMFKPLGTEGIWLSRWVSVLYSMLSIAACVALGTALDDHRSGLISGLLYAVLPMTVFHERQALTEPVMVAFTALSTLLIVWSVKRPRWWIAPLLGLTLTLAYYTKLFALPYLVLPLVGALLLSQRERLRQTISMNALATVIALALIYGVGRWAAFSGVEIKSDWAARPDNSILRMIGTPELTARFRADFVVLTQIATRYTGLVVVLLVLLAGVWLIKNQRRRELLFLAVPGLGFALTPLLIIRTTGGDILPPRYFLTYTAPLFVLAALSLGNLLRWLADRRPAAARVVLALVCVMVLAQGVIFTVLLIRDPLTAPLADIEFTTQYHLSFQGDFTEMGAALLAELENVGERQVYIVGTGLELTMLQAQSGARYAHFANYPYEADLPDIARWLADGALVYFIDGTDIARQSGVEPADQPEWAQLEFVTSSHEFGSEVALYRLTRIQGAETAAALIAVTPDPEKIAESLAAAGAATRTNTLVYPPHYAEPVHASSAHELTPIHSGVWPLDRRAVFSVLDTHPLTMRDGRALDVLLVDEARSDPQHELALAVQSRLYCSSAQWFELAHLLTCYTGSDRGELPLLNGEFEDVIHLAAGGTLDPEARPGEVARFALEWMTDVPVEDSFKVFVHITGADETLYAQHDGEPGWGLLPMPDWQPGETVHDQFAIDLPLDIPSGDYEIRVGLYHPEHGTRLRVTNGADPGLSYIPVGALRVLDAE